MASCGTNKKMRQMVAGVSFISDGYPNTKYKVNYLLNKQGFKNNVYRLSIGKNRNSFWNSKKAFLVIELTFKSIVCFFRILLFRPDIVYLPYPGIILAALFNLYPAKKRPGIYIDSIISIYDTVVIDRKLFKPDSSIAGYLYRLEKLAYKNSKTVITDTKESSRYFSELFNIPIEKFKDCVLAQVPIRRSIRIANNDDILRCLFIGTFIPLQGAEIIAETICRLKPNDNIHVTLVGRGQTSPLVENILKNADNKKYTWKKAWLSITNLEKEIQKADLCLGIFGNTPKANRVWPFKNYLYLAAGCPIVTSKTSCAKFIKNKEKRVPIYFPDSNNAEDILTLLRKLSLEKYKIEMEREKARDFYKKHLSNTVSQREFYKILFS